MCDGWAQRHTIFRVRVTARFRVRVKTYSFGHSLIRTPRSRTQIPLMRCLSDMVMIRCRSIRVRVRLGLVSLRYGYDQMDMIRCRSIRVRVRVRVSVSLIWL